MKYLVINNLVSGFRDGGIYDFIRSYTQDGDEVCIRSTDGSTNVASLVTDADEYDFVVASGGDGTIAAVTYELRDSKIPILPFPAGTANLLALNIYQPMEPHALAKQTAAGKLLDFDMGEITTENNVNRGFTMMAGCGYDYVIMSEASQNKQLLGAMSYFQAAFANPEPQFSKFNLLIDGKQVKSSGIGVLLINFSKIQLDVSLTQENSPRDGKFDIIILKVEKAIELLPTLLAKMVDGSGELSDRTGTLEIYRGAEIEVVADPPMLIQYDGEPSLLTTPFKARVLPKAGRYIVSEECLRQFAD